MAKQIAKLLKASIQETSDLKEIAKMLAKKGRGGDTMLAHITPKEAAVLKESGGAGTVNPDTGLLEFYDGNFKFSDYADFDAPNIQTGGYGTRAPSSPPINIAEQAARFSPVGNLDQSFARQQDIDFTPIPNVASDPNAGFVPRTVSPPALPAYDPQGFTTYGFGSPATFQYGQPEAPTAAAPVAPERSALQRYIGDPLKQLKAETGITGADLARVGIAGAGAIAGYQQQQKAARQIEQAVAEQKALAEPYRQRGEELQRAAMAGEMTPQSAQAFQALRAQLAQGAEARGGVGAAQAAAQLEAFRTNLLQNQYDFGLKVSQIGDQVALGAIRTGMQLDQQLGQANQQFYAQLASIAAGGTYGYQPPTRT